MQQFWSFYHKTWNCSKIKGKLAMFGHTNKDTHSNIVSEFEKAHMLLYSQPPSSWELSLLHKRTASSLCLMLAILLTLLPLSLVFTPLPSPDSFKECSQLHKSFGGRPIKLSPINHHVVHLITTRKAENAVQVTKSLKNITNQSLSTTKVRCHLKKAGMKAMEKKMPSSFCQASQSLFGLCSCP